MATDPAVGPVSQVGGSEESGQTTLGESTRKLTKAEAGYDEKGGIPGLRCSDCQFFNDGQCGIVEGPVSPDGVSDEFQPNFRGNMSSDDFQAASAVSRDFGMFITRVSTDQQGVRRWHAKASGVKRDLYGERMSVGLFEDFIKRIKSGETPPEPFISKAWTGGMPYIGVAHYLDLEGFGIVGTTERMWVDGSLLKARGLFNDSPLAKSAFDTVRRDIAENVPDAQRVRVSIAFLDYGHAHDGRGEFIRQAISDNCPMCEEGVDGKEYRRGIIVHMALTRRPAYPETDFQLEERSMEKRSRRDDAASIVGAEMADELEKRAKAGVTERSVAEDLVVVRQEGMMASPGPTPAPSTPATSAEAMMTGTAEAMIETMSLEGAKTLEDAEAYLTKSAGTVVLDSWGVLDTVLRNISVSNDPPDAKAAAVREAVAGFQKRLDVQTAQALADVSQVLKPVLKQGGEMTKKTEDLKAREEAPAEETEEEKKKREEEERGYAEEKSVVARSASHPLDATFAAIRAKFDEAVATPVERKAKLQMVQPEVTRLGEVIIASIDPVAPGQVDMAALGDMLKQRVDEALAPYLPFLAQLGPNAVRTVQPTTVRRAFRPGPGAAVAAEAAPATGIRAIARRSVGLSG